MEAGREMRGITLPFPMVAVKAILMVILTAVQLVSIFNNIGGGVSNNGLTNIGSHMGKATGLTVGLSNWCIYYSSNESGDRAWAIMFYGGGALIQRLLYAKVPYDSRCQTGGHIPVLAF